MNTEHTEAAKPQPVKLTKGHRVESIDGIFLGTVSAGSSGRSLVRWDHPMLDHVWIDNDRLRDASA